ncbi:MAG: outer membrane beta-barrel protein [Legionella sp.]|jgi:outer membrane immunogenic protein
MERLKHYIAIKHLSSPLVALLLCGVFSTNSIANAQQLSVDKDGVLARYDWSGPSVGAYIGGAWGTAKKSTNVGSVTNTAYYNSLATINSVNQSGSGTISSNAFIGGIQFSDNFFICEQYILGLVMDYGALNLNAVNDANNVAYPDHSGNYSLETSVTTSWAYTARARLGYAISSLSKPVLLYMTGGLALTNLSIKNNLTDTNTLLGVGGSKNKGNQTGWALGAGFELPITDNLTVNSEYLYMQFGTIDVNSSIYNSTQGFGIDSHALVNPFNTSASLYVNLFKVGLNYKFKTV